MPLLTIAKIPVRLHRSFLLLAGVMVGWEWLQSGFSAAVSAALLGGLVFGSVLLHELGHALAGRAFGVATRDITLYPFGGVARMDMGALAPRTEIVVSLAGPLVNLLLFGLGVVLASLRVPLAEPLAIINLGLGVFNLIPAFPMDGGRVLRAVLSLRRSPQQATLGALSVSRYFAWAFILGAPLLSSWSLALVGAFLLFAIRGERLRLAHESRLQQAGVLPTQTSPSPWSEPETDQLTVAHFAHPVR